jgi:hypothetical protein
LIRLGGDLRDEKEISGVSTKGVTRELKADQEVLPCTIWRLDVLFKRGHESVSWFDARGDLRVVDLEQQPKLSCNRIPHFCNLHNAACPPSVPLRLHHLAHASRRTWYPGLPILMKLLV